MIYFYLGMAIVIALIVYFYYFFSRKKYLILSKKVIYEPVKLEQNYRNFDFESPWEGTSYLKEIKNLEKDGKKN